MNCQNIDAIHEVNGYGEHLFCLNNKDLSFFTDQCQQKDKCIQTKVSTLGKQTGRSASKNEASERVRTEQLFEVGFLQEHEIIVNKYIKNYMELLSNNQHEPQSFISSSLEQGKDYSRWAKTIETIEEACQYLNQDKILRMDEILKHNNLACFLQNILSKHGSQVGLALIKITCQIWQEYSRSNNSRLEGGEIVELVSKMLTSSFLKKVRQLLPQKGKEQSRCKLKTFMNVLTNTVLFIANQYFINPYYQLQEQLIVQQFQNYELYLYDPSVSVEDESESDEQDGSIFRRGRKMIKQQTSI